MRSFRVLLTLVLLACGVDPSGDPPPPAPDAGADAPAAPDAAAAADGPAPRPPVDAPAGESRATADAPAAEARPDAPGHSAPAAPPLRGLWVTRFAFRTAADVRGVVNRAADAGFDAVFFQIRGTFDAFYRSRLEPWSALLTGTLGRDPGWDPLRVALDAAHARGVQLHAYFNVFSAWPGSATCDPTAPPRVPASAGGPAHLLARHPTWTTQDRTRGYCVDAEYFWAPAGNPQVIDHVVAVARDLLASYPDVDGLHLDRVRYPSRVGSYDAASLAAYAAAHPEDPRGENAASWQAWHRAQVSRTVARLHETVRAASPPGRPKLLSAAVWGIYEPLTVDGRPCATSAGNRDYLQDSLTWARDGYIDALMPMIYWNLGSGCTDFARLVASFVAGARGRAIHAGVHALTSGRPDFAALTGRIDAALSRGAQGTVVFASTYLDQHALWEAFSRR